MAEQLVRVRVKTKVVSEEADPDRGTVRRLYLPGESTIVSLETAEALKAAFPEAGVKWTALAEDPS